MDETAQAQRLDKLAYMYAATSAERLATDIFVEFMA
jgi:hypothetical protein